MIEICGISEEQLPKLFESYEVVGTLKGEIASELGLSEQVKAVSYTHLDVYKRQGYTQTFEVYGCSDCSGCGHKAKCLYKYDAEKDAEKNKVMTVSYTHLDVYKRQKE